MACYQARYLVRYHHNLHPDLFSCQGPTNETHLIGFTTIGQLSSLSQLPQLFKINSREESILNANLLHKVILSKLRDCTFNPENHLSQRIFIPQVHFIHLSLSTASECLGILFTFYYHISQLQLMRFRMRMAKAILGLFLFLALKTCFLVQSAIQPQQSIHQLY